MAKSDKGTNRTKGSDRTKSTSAGPSTASGSTGPGVVETIARIRGGFDPGFILRIQLEETLTAQAYVFVDRYGSEAWRTNDEWETLRPGDDPATSSWKLRITRVARKDVPGGDPNQGLGPYPVGADFDARAKAFFDMPTYLAGPGGGWYKLKREVVWHSVLE